MRRSFKVWLTTEVDKGKKFPLAHALDTDTVAQGEDHVDALRNLRTALELELDHMKKTGVNSWEKAPPEYWERAKEKGVLVTLDL